MAQCGARRLRALAGSFFFCAYMLLNRIMSQHMRFGVQRQARSSSFIGHGGTAAVRHGAARHRASMPALAAAKGFGAAPKGGKGGQKGKPGSEACPCGSGKSLGVRWPISMAWHLQQMAPGCQNLMPLTIRYIQSTYACPVLGCGIRRFAFGTTGCSALMPSTPQSLNPQPRGKLHCPELLWALSHRRGSGGHA